VLLRGCDIQQVIMQTFIGKNKEYNNIVAQFRDRHTQRHNNSLGRNGKTYVPK